MVRAVVVAAVKRWADRTAATVRTVTFLLNGIHLEALERLHDAGDEGVLMYRWV
jgi:hypothetical protein